MLSSQAINLVNTTPPEGVKAGKHSQQEAAPGKFGDVYNQQAAATTDKAPASTKPADQAEQPPVDENAITETEDNLYLFPAPPITEQATEEDSIILEAANLWVPHLSMLPNITNLVSILEGYSNNMSADTEIVPLLQALAQQLSQLEQPLSPKAAELQGLIEEVLARTPQNQDIELSSPQAEKFAEIIKILRGNPSPLENVNEENNKVLADTPEGEAVQLKPIINTEQKAAADDNGKQQPKEDKATAPINNNQNQPAAFRVDVAPQKVIFTDHMQAAQGAPRFVPFTPESLFDTMVQRIVALPGAEPHMEISLKPDHLGKLSIDLSLGEQGLTAKIIASDEGVRNMLAAQINRLSETLAEKGIRVENVEIVYSAMADKQSDQRQSAQQEKEGGKNNSYRPLWGAIDSLTGTLDNAYTGSPYMDEWGFSSVEYQA